MVETKRSHRGMNAGGRGAGGSVAGSKVELDSKVMILGEAKRNKVIRNAH